MFSNDENSFSQVNNFIINNASDKGSKIYAWLSPLDLVRHRDIGSQRMDSLKSCELFVVLVPYVAHPRPQCL